MESTKRIVGIDPGSSICGIAIIDDGKITGAFNCQIPALWSKISGFLIHPNILVAVEDIKPYSMRLTPAVIDTCKLIGEIVYRLKNEAGVEIRMVTRSEVKKWVFDSFTELCVERIKRKMDKKMFPACSLETKQEVYVDAFGRSKRKENFTQIDDNIVTNAMRVLYNIEPSKRGQKSKNSIKSHAWQALAIASYVFSLK